MSERVSVANLNPDLARRMAELRDPRFRERMESSRGFVDAAAQGDEPVYGVNTGFGILKNKRIAPEQTRTLQRNLLLSHAVGVGDPVPPPIAFLMLQLKIHALGLGYSGVSRAAFDFLLKLEALGLIPHIPSRGSVGASGDLAPLAHLALPLIGQGAFWSDDQTRAEPAAEVLARRGLRPIELEAKDGLALINGTQLMAAYAAYISARCIDLAATADIAAAMSLEALQGSLVPFDERIQQVRPHPGQAMAAANVRALLRDSEIMESHRECGKVQDPYCLRCVPQVHGACRDALGYARSVTDIEINSATDNPLVFEDGRILSGGNFHGQPLAFALDFAAIALAEFGGISERRTYLLLEGHDGLPPLLMKETGLNSGFMIPQYTAAALVSENKVLAHPASVDSIPTCLGQEDHVSMGSVAALKLWSVFGNIERILAIELLTAAQALDYRQPLQPGVGVRSAHRRIRERVRHREADQTFQNDLAQVTEMVRTGELPHWLATQGIEVR